MINIKLTVPAVFFNEETRCDYVVSTEMKEIWAVELDLMQQVLDFCYENNLKIWACGGTILGAVRHGGMIPWDDDIDLMMPREDFDKFCLLGKKFFKEPYYLELPIHEDFSNRYKSHAKLRNSTTTAILSSEMKYRRFSNNLGIFVDIFPLDAIPNNERKAKRHLKKIRNSIRWANACYLFVANYRNHIQYHTVAGEIKNKIFSVANLICNYRNRYRKIEQLVQKYNGNSDIYGYGCISSWYLGDRFCWNKSFFDCKTIMMDFEFLKVPVLEYYDLFLCKTYNNWHKIVKGGAVHTVVYFNPRECYTDIIKRIGPIESEIRSKGLLEDRKK